ncbi:MAG TPA: hypothetical protein VFU46_06225, partial [Gemmatimonadales bacterium]|nr:hypothetical protein [Gemmatimonadales bacterium]
MPGQHCAPLGALLLACAVQTAVAQTSPYLPLDDARLPLLEHLILRGDLEDPSPMIRPFRLADAARVLAAADTAPDRGTGALIRELRESVTEDTARARWSLAARLGGQAYTQKRRDPLHLGGARAANPYLDFTLQGVFGPVVGSTRPALDPRLIGDPDWPNTAQEHVTGRLVEGYLGVQFKYGAITYGQLDRNWGPAGLPGIAISDVGYERQGLALELGTDAVRLHAFASDLRRQRDSIGQSVNRYFFAHRLEARLSRGVRLGVWETLIIQGVGRGFETPFANPLSPSVIANSFGIADSGSNVMFGLDLTWSLGRRTRLQFQGGLDDFWFNDRRMRQDRWAYTVAGAGALGARLGWYAWYTQASSLAFRTQNPQENFADQGVGIGRNFSDMDQTRVAVAIPVARTWLITPDLTFQRQGEGRIGDPYP